MADSSGESPRPALKLKLKRSRPVPSPATASGTDLAPPPARPPRLHSNTTSLPSAAASSHSKAGRQRSVGLPYSSPPPPASTPPLSSAHPPYQPEAQSPPHPSHARSHSQQGTPTLTRNNSHHSNSATHGPAAPSTPGASNPRRLKKREPPPPADPDDVRIALHAALNGGGGGKTYSWTTGGTTKTKGEGPPPVQHSASAGSTAHPAPVRGRAQGPDAIYIPSIGKVEDIDTVPSDMGPQPPSPTIHSSDPAALATSTPSNPIAAKSPPTPTITPKPRKKRVKKKAPPNSGSGVPVPPGTWSPYASSAAGGGGAVSGSSGMAGSAPGGATRPAMPKDAKVRKWGRDKLVLPSLTGHVVEFTVWRPGGGVLHRPASPPSHLTPSAEHFDPKNESKDPAATSLEEAHSNAAMDADI